MEEESNNKYYTTCEVDEGRNEGEEEGEEEEEVKKERKNFDCPVRFPAAACPGTINA